MMPINSQFICHYVNENGPFTPFQHLLMKCRFRIKNERLSCWYSNTISTLPVTVVLKQPSFKSELE